MRAVPASPNTHPKKFPPPERPVWSSPKPRRGSFGLLLVLFWYILDGCLGYSGLLQTALWGGADYSNGELGLKMCFYRL